MEKKLGLSFFTSADMTGKAKLKKKLTHYTDETLELHLALASSK